MEADARLRDRQFELGAASVGSKRDQKNSSLPWPRFVLVHAPRPKARSADQVRRNLIGRVGVASPFASPHLRQEAWEFPLG